MSSIDKNELIPAQRYIAGLDQDVKAVSALVPRILAQSDSESAYDLVNLATDNIETLNSWLPEALILFNTHGLNQAQKQVMNDKVFGGNTLSETALHNILSDCNARIGKDGFSFPQWRYIAQKFGGASLIERYGLQRLNRETDIRDPTLPDPASDQFGPGFIWSDGVHYIEYRRAYIVTANQSADSPVALVIRNSSHFFGRDRLPAPAYVSWQLLSNQEIQALTEDSLENSGLFARWQDSMNIPQHLQIERAGRVHSLLDCLDSFDAHLANWLHTPCSENCSRNFSGLGQRNGFEEFLSFLRYKAANPGGGPPGSPFIGIINGDMPPWFPEIALPLTPELVDRLDKYGKTDDPELQKFFESASQPSKKMILLTGKNGDFPIVPAKKADVKVQEPLQIQKLVL